MNEKITKVNENLALDVQNLEVKFVLEAETVHAVNGVSFSLEKGHTLGDRKSTRLNSSHVT